MGLHPGCAQGQGQRSGDMDTSDYTKIASSTTNMTGSPPNLHMMVPRRACIQDVLKVKVKTKGHLIRTLLWFHENRFFAGKWLDREQTCTQWSPDGPASRVCSRSRSKVTWYGHFCDVTKIASSHRQMAGSRPNLHTMVPSLGCIQGVLKVKVKVKGHVLRTLLWFHENRFFSQANGWNATKLAHDGSQPGVHPGCARGQGRGQRMSRNVCYTVRSHVLSLHALTLWNTIILSCQYKYQAARCLNIGMSYSVIDGLVN